MSAEEAARLVRSGDRVFIHGSAATPVRLVRALLDRHAELHDVELTAISTFGDLGFDRPEVQGWVRAGRPGVMHIHPALLTAAAVARVNRNGRFAVDRLGERIRALAEGEFADWQWPEADDTPA